MNMIGKPMKYNIGDKVFILVGSEHVLAKIIEIDNTTSKPYKLEIIIYSNGDYMRPVGKA